ncbi:MAG: FapA family protein [Patescibacteria group bacterium]|nr:FapA family protein [Patescibacteria group bacterium]
MLKKLIFLFIIFGFGVFNFSHPVFSQENPQENKNVVLPQGQTVNADYFAAGDSVTLSGTVNGDAYLAGGNILVDGLINGDLLEAGGNVNINGEIKNDLRVVGGQVTLSGVIGGNVTVVGGSINLTNTAKINGSLVVTGGSAMVFSPIGKGINGACGQMTLGSSVGGDVFVAVSQLTLSSQANLSGKLTYLSQNEAQIDQGAKVAGEVVHQSPPSSQKNVPNQKALAGIGFSLKLIDLLSSLVVGLLLLHFFPVFSQTTLKQLPRQPWKVLGIGFLVLLITPIIIFILLITLIGVPLALILLALFLFAIYLAKIFIAIFLGQKLLQTLHRESKLGWSLFLGLIIWGIISFVPLLGWLLLMIGLWFGVGMVILSVKELYSLLRGKNLL